MVLARLMQIASFFFGHRVGRIVFTSLKDVFKRAAFLGRASVPDDSQLADIAAASLDNFRVKFRPYAEQGPTRRKEYGIR
jgi:hypothetical protein